MKIYASVINVGGPKIYAPQLSEKLYDYSGNAEFDVRNIKFTEVLAMPKIEVITKTRRKLQLLCKPRDAFILVEEVDVNY